MDLSPKPHYSCYKSADTSSDKPEEEVEDTASSKSEKEAEDASCDKPKEEVENACDKPEEEVEDVKATVFEEKDSKQKRKEIEHSSLFNIADAKSGDVDRMRTPAPNALEDPVTQGTPDVENLVQGAKNRSQKSPNTKSPNKSPRELLQAVPLPPAES